MTDRLRHEYAAVRNAAGLWLRNDAALIRISGADRFTWLQGMISNDTTLLTSESATRLPACVLDATGHLISVITLTTPPDQADSLFMETPAAQRATLLSNLDRYLITEDVQMEPCNLATVTFQGPVSGAIAAGVCHHMGIAYYAADHTGSGGFDCYLPTGFVGELVREAALRGAAEIGQEARDLLRIEAGIPKYAVDMDATSIALEAGLGPTYISMTKGCYVGQEIIARIDSRGHTNRALTGLVITGAIIPSRGDLIMSSEAEAAKLREIGRVTSAASASPAMGGRPIALGYVRHEHRWPGTSLRIGALGTLAEVVELPFWRG